MAHSFISVAQMKSLKNGKNSNRGIQQVWYLVGVLYTGRWGIVSGCTTHGLACPFLVITLFYVFFTPPISLFIYVYYIQITAPF